jgi:hypothetical protein
VDLDALTYQSLNNLFGNLDAMGHGLPTQDLNSGMFEQFGGDNHFSDDERDQNDEEHDNPNNDQPAAATQPVSEIASVAK